MNSKVRSINEKIVVVVRQPGDYRVAKYKESDIEKLHWDNISQND